MVIKIYIYTRCADRGTIMKLEKDIAIWNSVLNTEECQNIIDRYDVLESLNLSYSRLDLHDSPSHKKNDRAVFLLGDESIRVTPDMSFLHPFLNKFWICWDQYLQHYSVLGETGKHYIRSMKIQKTLPGQGYHIWHFESDGHERSSRISAWGLYLNEIAAGGETEFLYQGMRVPATAGTLVIWPAGYTHVHRGNPPLSGEKFIITGWVEW